MKGIFFKPSDILTSSHNGVRARGFKLWTDSDVDLLKQLYVSGLPMKDIAIALDRSLASVTKRSRMYSWGSSRFKRFSSDEDDFIRSNYVLIPLASIAQSLSRHPNSVTARARILGLPKGYLGEHHHASTISDNDVELVRQLHDEGLPITVISEKMEISYDYCLDLISYKSRNNIPDFY